MTAQPLVSIIVPTYNQSKYVASCLDSIWHQDYPKLELIVVNDGCTYGTDKVLGEYERDVIEDIASYASWYNSETDILDRVTHDRYPKQGRTLRVITHEKNKGLAAALNTGFTACTGKYCTYVPSDDLCYPNMVETLVDALEKNEADFAFSDMVIREESGRIVRRFSLPDYSFKTNFADWYLCGVSKLYKRELHDRFGLYDEALLAHDHDLFQRFALGGAKFVHVPKALMSLLSHEGPRAVGIHSPTNWNRLLQESKALVLEARKVSANHDLNGKR